MKEKLLKQGIPEELINDFNVAFVVLTKDKFTIVDSYNQLWLMNLCGWHLDNKGYARGNIKGQSILMHKIIANKLKFDSKLDVDHIHEENSYNKIDNRELNLREATRSQNRCNIKKYKNNKSGEKDIHWHKISNCWQVQIQINYKTKQIGIFKTLKEAIIARDDAIKIYHGEFMRV